MSTARTIVRTFATGRVLSLPRKKYRLIWQLICRPATRVRGGFCFTYLIDRQCDAYVRMCEWYECVCVTHTDVIVWCRSIVLTKQIFSEKDVVEFFQFFPLWSRSVDSCACYKFFDIGSSSCMSTGVALVQCIKKEGTNIKRNNLSKSFVQLLKTVQAT